MKSHAQFHRHALACAALAALGAMPAAAQTNSLEPVVITGSRTDAEFGARSGIPLSQMPQSVQLIDAEQIREFNAQSFGDVLRAVPSANVGNSRVARYQSFSLKVRGFLADQMRNGMRQRYYEDIDASALSNVERVEVLKGPSSVLFGQSALGGILSIITKQPQRELAGEASVLFGSNDQQQASFDLTGALDADGKLLARLTGEIERSGTFVDYQDIDRENLGLSLSWAATDRARVYLVTEYVQRKTLGNPGLPVAGTVRSNGVAELPIGRYLGEPTQSPLTADAPLVQLWADFQLDDRWTLTPRYQYQQFNTDFTQVRVRGAVDPSVDLLNFNRSGRNGTEDDSYQIAQLDLSGRLVTGALTHRLLGGFEWSRERGTFYQETLTNVTSINAVNPVYSFSTTAPEFTFAFDSVGNVDGRAFYVQDVIGLTPDLDVIAGLRHSRFDYHSAFTTSAGTDLDDSSISATTWQLAANWRFKPDWSAFGGVNTGLDIENVLGTRTVDGSPFKPERADQIEAGLRYITPSISASAALFQIRRQDVITAHPDADLADQGFSVQTGEQRVRGIELEGSWRASERFSLSGGYAYMKGEVTRSNDGDEGDELGDTPRHNAVLRGEWRLPAGLVARAGVNGVSSRKLTNGSEVELAGYGLVDLGLGWRSDGGRWSVDATLNNVLDKRYFTATGNSFTVYPGDPRGFGLRLSARL